MLSSARLPAGKVIRKPLRGLESGALTAERPPLVYKVFRLAVSTTQYYTSPMILRIIVILVFVGIITAGIYHFSGLQTRIDVQQQQSTHAETITAASHPYVSVGDKLGAMTVISVAPFNTGQYSQDPSLMTLGSTNAHVVLKGPIEITGMYSGYFSSPIGFDGYCMNSFDAASLSKLPTLPGNPEAPQRSFCFSNTDYVKKELGEKASRVTILIDNYELNSYPAEVIDNAQLVSVIHQ